MVKYYRIWLYYYEYWLFFSDATKRANNAETPAAHVFNDVGLDDPMADIDLPMNESMKRSLLEAGMDIDDEEVIPKKRRD